jgi:hypothetical protein
MDEGGRAEGLYTSTRTTDNGEAPDARDGASLLVAALAEIELLDAEADADLSDSYSLHRDHANRRAADADADAEHNLIEETAFLIPEMDEEPTLPRRPLM